MVFNHQIYQSSHLTELEELRAQGNFKISKDEISKLRKLKKYYIDMPLVNPTHNYLMNNKLKVEDEIVDFM